MRQYFPKNKNFDEISDFELQTVYETSLEDFNRLSTQTLIVALKG